VAAIKKTTSAGTAKGAPERAIVFTRSGSVSTYQDQVKYKGAAKQGRAKQCSAMMLCANVSV
jgi:hypothetical protein